MARNSEEPLRIVVHGSTGRMGRVLLNAIANADDVSLVASASSSVFRAHAPNGDVTEHGNLDDLLRETAPDVVVDFSSRDAVVPLATASASQGANLVTGTSGIAQSEINIMEAMARNKNIGVMVGPNFSLGAVVLERVASEAGRHFAYAEIIEMHHVGKADAPSGSAMATARGMLEARDGQQFANPAAQFENLEGVRGGDIDGVAIHSVRMPGLMAHQQVLLGGPGETLTLRHDVIDRESYMPGVLLAIREVGNRRGQLTYGLGALLWPEQKGE